MQTPSSTFVFIKKNPAFSDKYNYFCIMNIPSLVNLKQYDEWDFCVRLYSPEGIFEKHKL